jgi:hypothetical protein
MDAKQCNAFKQNPSVNPMTGRKIDPEGTLAKKLKTQCKFAELTSEDCKRWKANITRNPLTGRKINLTAKTGIYQQLLKACKEPAPNLTTKAPKLTRADCGKWKADPTHHPHTGRKLNLKAKKGIYQQLVNLCKDTNPSTHHLAPKPHIVTNADRNKLISVMKKRLSPILHKGDSTKSRVAFYRIMQEYLVGLKPCLTTVDRKLALVNDKNEPIVKFQKRIGSKSVYGMAYMNMGKGFAKLLKFSCKLMSDSVPGHTEEVKILKLMSNAVIDGKTPNMPLTYLSMNCTKPCGTNPRCPDVAKNNGYFVVVNELASMDLQTWFKKTHSTKAYESVLFQLLLSLYSFHQLGYSHNDTHLGNYLIHEITPGGYWRYKVNGEEVYIPNVGYLVVLWDPGMALPINNNDPVIDYYRTFSLITVLGSLDIYRQMKLVPLPPTFTLTLDSILNYLTKIPYSYEKKAISRYLQYAKRTFKHVVIAGAPPGYLLNIKPYVIG